MVLNELISVTLSIVLEFPFGLCIGLVAKVCKSDFAVLHRSGYKGYRASFKARDNEFILNFADPSLGQFDFNIKGYSIAHISHDVRNPSGLPFRAPSCFRGLDLIIGEGDIDSLM